MAVEDCNTVNVALLPADLLQLLGEHLSPRHIRDARLVCKSWATALAVCMPTITMALPQDAPSAVFRQPLVLCSSGPLGSTQSAQYAAVPRSALPTAATPAAIAGAKPSPFATRGGQAVMNSLAAGSSSSPKQSPFIRIAESLPSGALPGMEIYNHQYEPAAPVVPSTAAVAAGHLHWQDSGVLQSWSSLPTAGLKTCRSLQQLKLQLSGAPPSPHDLLDLSTLPHLTHLSLRQVGNLSGFGSCSQQLALDAATSGLCVAAAAAHGTELNTASSSSSSSSSSSGACSARSSSSSSSSSSASASASTSSGAMPALLQPDVSSMADTAADALNCFHLNSPSSASSSRSSCLQIMGNRMCSSSTSSNTLRPIHAAFSAGSPASVHSFWGSDTSEHADEGGAHSNDSIISKAGNRQHMMDWLPQTAAAAAAAAAKMKAAATDDSPNLDDIILQRDQDLVDHSSTACAAAEMAAAVAAAAAPQYVSCSVLTPEHVEALAQLPRLSSLELQPKDGQWDTAGTAALLQLSQLTGLTRLSITWGCADTAEAPFSNQEAVEQAHGAQLPLQQCLLGLIQLKELELKGCPVVDVQVIQGMQQLQRLKAEALKVVNSDVLLRLQQQSADSTAAAGEDDALAAAADQQQQQMPTPKWATLPLLEQVQILHPASDISVLIQGTHTPILSNLGFVARGSGDFARLLSQHGKIRVLHLVFPEDEPWHTIAVVRLPTALPALRSLTLEGKFWLPNSLIVALGVMEVPLQELSLKCKLAVPCLDRLQYLKTVKRLGLHHVVVPGPPEGLITKDIMLQLPAKLLPPGLRELEISNGWILH